jgi:hypothetical protein
MADGEGHGDNGEPERQRDPEKTYSHVWKRSGNYGAPASAQNQPKCTDELGSKLPRERHDDSLSSLAAVCPALRSKEGPAAKITESPPQVKP